MAVVSSGTRAAHVSTRSLILKTTSQDSRTKNCLLTVRLQLRPDVKCALHESGGQPYYQVEDPLNSKFYRLGMREWNFARQLDGTRTLKEVLAEQNALSPNELTIDEAVAIGRWLVQTQLATSGADSHPMFIRAARTGAKLPNWLNPAFLRVPLGNPDRFLTAVTPWLAWTTSPTAVVVWCAVGILAIYQITLNWSRFWAPMGNVFSPDNWLYLVLAWLILKIVHEFYHGLVCKKYGGRVPTFGLLFILFSPVAFVDVTSSWKFRSKWQRIFTAAAGMYAEWFIAALATFVWASTEQPLLSQTCQNIITTATLSTLLFNGNFLMRFDGYYILSDLLGLQNLYGTGQQFVRYLFRRYLLGVPAQPLVGDARKIWAARLYGPASLAWRVTFYLGILLTAATMFQGAGIVLSLMVGVTWILLPTGKFLVYLVRGRGTEQPNRTRCFSILGSLTAIVTAILLLPWPGAVVAWGVVDYDPLALIRAETGGFLRNVHVTSGQTVTAGTRLASIENRQTKFELTAVEHSVDQSTLQLRTWQDEKMYDRYQQETKRLQRLNEQRTELAEKVDSLELSAPCNGRVIGRDLDTLVDRYVHTGDPIAAIGQEDRKAILVAVAQKDADFFLRQLGVQPHVRIKGRLSPIPGAQLLQIHPRASKRLTHPGLAATHGGPLPVRPSTDDHEPDQMVLLEPHFLATIHLPPDQARQLKAGELAKVRLDASGHNVGQHLWATATRWIRKRLGEPS